MPIIDSQVHAYEANTPKRPWHSVPNWPPHVTGDEMVAAMDRVGVDGAIFISAFSLYQYDASYAVEVQRRHPGRFAIIKPVNPADPAVGEVIAEWKKQPGAVAVRIMMTAREDRLRPDEPGHQIPDAYEIVTLYTDTGEHFLTFSGSTKTLLRIERNKHPLRHHPVHFLVLEKDDQQPLG